MDGCVKGRSRPWMTVHQNSVQILNTPIIFDDIFIREEDAARVFCFVKNYANRGGRPIKRFCEFKFHTSLEAEVFVETYKTVIQTVVEHPRSANDNADEENHSTKNNIEIVQGLPLLHHDAVNDDYYDDEDFDDLCEDTQNPFA
jgi:hypothetical protein